MGIASLLCIISLLIASVANVLMNLGCQGKGTEAVTMFKPGNYYRESYTYA